MISYFIIFILWICTTTAAILPSYTSNKLLDDKNLYSIQPSEILPIEPVLIYPALQEKSFKSRAYSRDNEIIYIKLLQRKSYRPQKFKNPVESSQNPPRELQMKDIFYVKALANGQFSQNRLKLYRLPEFYAITVYKKIN